MAAFCVIFQILPATKTLLFPVSRHGAGTHLRLEGRVAAAHWPTRYLCHIAGPRGSGGRNRQRHAAARRALSIYRDNAALLWRGASMEDILVFWGGDERGSRSGPAHDFPLCIPVGSQAVHAAGVAYAFKYRKQARVAVCIFGDGATSKGDVWEAMNFAGIWKLPVVFVVNNNQWAISVPLKWQTASQTLAQKAIAAGFPGEQVDGNGLIAVHVHYLLLCVVHEAHALLHTLAYDSTYGEGAVQVVELDPILYRRSPPSWRRPRKSIRSARRAMASASEDYRFRWSGSSASPQSILISDDSPRR